MLELTTAVLNLEVRVLITGVKMNRNDKVDTECWCPPGRAVR
jgi:hypothetical protein